MITRELVRKEIMKYEYKEEHFNDLVDSFMDLSMDYDYELVNLEGHIYDFMKNYYN